MRDLLGRTSRAGLAALLLSAGCAAGAPEAGVPAAPGEPWTPAAPLPSAWPARAEVLERGVVPEPGHVYGLAELSRSVEALEAAGSRAPRVAEASPAWYS